MPVRIVSALLVVLGLAARPDSLRTESSIRCPPTRSNSCSRDRT